MTAQPWAPVAVVGAGTMGRWFVRHLLASGARVIVADLSPAAQADAAAAGAELAGSAAEAAREAQSVLLSLPSPAVVEAAALGAGGVIDAARPGLLVVDLSTSPPPLARRLAEVLGERGADVLDAPVSGGPVGAEAASLTVMVGGPTDVAERARPLLELLGSHVVHVGGPGAGQAAKVCNNLLAGVQMAAIAQMLAIARAEGLDPGVLFDLVTRSTGDSRVLRARYPAPGVDDKHPSNRGFEPLFTVDLMAKDLALAAELIAGHGLGDEPLAGARRLYDAAQAAGLGALDYSALGVATGAVDRPA